MESFIHNEHEVSTMERLITYSKSYSNTTAPSNTRRQDTLTERCVMFEAVFQCKLMLRARSCNWISGEEAFTKIKLHHEKLLRVGSGYNSMNILV